jgi:hypothetical protein
MEGRKHLHALIARAFYSGGMQDRSKHLERPFLLVLILFFLVLILFSIYSQVYCHGLQYINSHPLVARIILCLVGF